MLASKLDAFYCFSLKAKNLACELFFQVEMYDDMGVLVIRNTRGFTRGEVGMHSSKLQNIYVERNMSIGTACGYWPRQGQGYFYMISYVV